MAPLTDLISTKDLSSTNDKKNKLRKIIWSEKCQKAFDEMKRLVSRDILLAYPRFDQPFEVYTDASKYQLGSVIVQLKKPLAFFSRKLSNAQKKYTTREQELLSVVETLKEFKNILFGYEVIVYTDHLNLTHETLLMSSDRVMRWRLLLEEYGVKWKYIPGECNIMADILSRYPLLDTEDKEAVNAELFAMNIKETEEKFPLDFLLIAENQQQELKSNSKFKKFFKLKDKYFKTESIEGNKILTMNGKIYIPNNIRKRIINWYHYHLCHPGANRLQLTLAQTMYWPGMVADCIKYT